MGLKKSKQAGMGNVPALIGIILAVIWMIVGTLVVFLMFGQAKDAVKEIEATANSSTTRVETVVRVNSLHAKAEEFFNENNGYPLELSEATLPGVDPQFINDTAAGPIDTPVAPIATETDAEAYAEPSTAGQVQYVPYGCTTTCKGYVLRGNTGDGEFVTKYGLMNSR